MEASCQTGGQGSQVNFLITVSIIYAEYPTFPGIHVVAHSLLQNIFAALCLGQNEKEIEEALSQGALHCI